MGVKLTIRWSYSIFTCVLLAFILLSCVRAVHIEVVIPPDSELQEARELLRRGLIDEAQTLVSPTAGPTNSVGFVIWGECYEADGAWEAAVWNWHWAINKFPDNIEFRLHYWQSLLALARENTIRSDSIRRLIDRQGDELFKNHKSTGLIIDATPLPEPFAEHIKLEALKTHYTSLIDPVDYEKEPPEVRAHDYRNVLLAYWASVFLDDTLAKSRGDWLIEAFPDSQAVIDIVGGRYWDGLYPIWQDNEARVEYLKEFIRKYDKFSWKNNAWRGLIAAYGELKDSAAVVREAQDWVASALDDPYVLVTASSYMKDYGSVDSARAWAEQAYRFRDRLARPSHVPVEEWLLYGPQIRAKIPLELAEFRLDEDELLEAKQLAKESLDLAEYGVDEYATQAAQKYQMGRVLLAEGDTSTATCAFVETLFEGEVRNYHPGLADSVLRELYGFESDDELLEFCRKRKGYTGITFKRVTDDVGLGDAKGGRFAWGDYDNDGDEDLLIGGRRLYRNDTGSFIYLNTGAGMKKHYISSPDGRFVDVTDSAGLDAPGCHGGIWGDYDNDGNLDLFCFSSSSDSSKTERLFRNIGKGTFEDVTDASGDVRDYNSTEAAIWGDFNSDGRLDLYVAGYERPYDSASDMGSGWPDRLLIQDEYGTFYEQTEATGIIPPYGKHLCGRSPVACDFDRDGDLDLYVGNYRLQQNQFWINDGSGWFFNRAAWYKVDGEQVDGWWGHSIGCQWGDFDNDGDFDLVVGNLAHPRYIGFSNRTMLYRNDGYDEGFTDVRRQWGIKYDECHSEPLWGDLDNDGDLDLFITSVYPDRRSYLYRNDGDHFTDVTFLSGARIFNGWGCALADYDNDGDLDLVTRNSGRVELFRNETRGGNWLELTVKSLHLTNQSCIGGVVEVVDSEGRRQIRNIEGGKGVGSQSSLVVHFGLGDASVEKVIYSVGERTIEKLRSVKNMNIQDNIEFRALGTDQLFQIRPVR